MDKVFISKWISLLKSSEVLLRFDLRFLIENKLSVLNVKDYEAIFLKGFNIPRKSAIMSNFLTGRICPVLNSLCRDWPINQVSPCE